MKSGYHRATLVLFSIALLVESFIILNFCHIYFLNLISNVLKKPCIVQTDLILSNLINLINPSLTQM